MKTCRSVGLKVDKPKNFNRQIQNYC